MDHQMGLQTVIPMGGLTEILLNSKGSQYFPALLNFFQVNSLHYEHETYQCFFDTGSKDKDLINADFAQRLLKENSLLLKEPYKEGDIKILGQVVRPKFTLKCKVKTQRNGVKFEKVINLIPIEQLPMEVLLSAKSGKELGIEVQGVPNEIPARDVKEDLILYVMPNGQEIYQEDIESYEEELTKDIFVELDQKQEIELLLSEEIQEENESDEILTFSIEEAELEELKLKPDEKDDLIVKDAVQKELKENIENLTTTKKIEPLNLKIDEEKIEIPKRFPVAEIHKKAVDEEVNSWMEKGFIKVSNSKKQPLNLVIANKYDPISGELLQKKRICLDCRGINLGIQEDKNYYALPNIKSILQNTKGKSYFTEIDLKDAFLSLPLSQETGQYLTFQWNSCKFEFVKCPFGLNIMPSYFQNTIETILKEEIKTGMVNVYLDNIILATEDKETHIKVVKQVLKKLTEHNLQVNVSKCKWGHKTLRSLGYVFNGQYIGIDTTKLDKVQNYKSPTTVGEMRSFLGLLNYFRGFLINMSKIEAPLNQLRVGNKKDKITLNEKQMQAFQQLKFMLYKAPILSHADYSKPFHLSCDASNSGIGNALFQIHEEKGRKIKKLIGFNSRSLNQAEKQYDTPKLELLSLVFACQKWKHIVLGYDTTIYTDHKSLLAVNKQSSKIKQRWLEEINEVLQTAKIVHIRGQNNVLSDYLSRLNLSEPILLQETIKEVTDEKEKAKIMEKYHIACNHRGSKEVYKRILSEEKVYWKNIKEDLIKYKQSCSTCIKHDRVNVNHHLPRSHVALNVMDWTVSDTLGPLECTSEGYQYILILVDVTSRFCWIRPLKDKSAKEVAREIVKIWAGYGLSYKFTSDNGTEYSNQILDEICKLLLVEKRQITAFNPSANGLAESYVKQVRNAIKKMVKYEEVEIDGVKEIRYTEEWVQLLPQIESALNIRKNEVGISAFELMFGRSFWNDNNESEKVVTEEELTEKWRKINNMIFPAIKESMRRIFERNTNRILERRQTLLEAPIPIGAMVMLERKPSDIKSKMDPIYDGPYRVSNVRGKDGSFSYQLTHPDDREMIIEKAAAIIRLKVLSTPEIEKIQEFKREKKQIYYLVLFKGSKEPLWIEDDNSLLKGKIGKFLKENNIQI